MIFPLIVFQSLYGASFNCNKASTLVEQTDPYRPATLQLSKQYRGKHFLAIGYGAWSTGNVSQDMYSDTKLKLNSSLQIFTFTEEHGVTGYIKKIHHDISQEYGKDIVSNKIQTAYILEVEWKIKILDDMDTADSAALVEEIQLIIPENLVEYSQSAVREYRKIHVIGKFSKGCKGDHIRDIVMDVKSISIVK